MWDLNKKGGRWFECNIRKAEEGKFWADPVADGDSPKKFAATRFSQVKVTPAINDTVIVYYDKRNYAFKGTYSRDCTEKKDGKFIDWDDGSSHCMTGWKVHKFEGIPLSEVEGEAAADEPEAAEAEEEPLTQYNGSHFVMWDINTKGGRWYETNVRQSETKG